MVLNTQLFEMKLTLPWHAGKQSTEATNPIWRVLLPRNRQKLTKALQPQSNTTNATDSNTWSRNGHASAWVHTQAGRCGSRNAPVWLTTSFALLGRHLPPPEAIPRQYQDAQNRGRKHTHMCTNPHSDGGHYGASYLTPIRLAWHRNMRPPDRTLLPSFLAAHQAKAAIGMPRHHAGSFFEPHPQADDVSRRVKAGTQLRNDALLCTEAARPPWLQRLIAYPRPATVSRRYLQSC